MADFRVQTKNEILQLDGFVKAIYGKFRQEQLENTLLLAVALVGYKDSYQKNFMNTLYFCYLLNNKQLKKILGWLFKDNLQNIELVELNIAPENPGLAPQTQPQAPSQIPLAPKPVEVERPTVSGLQKTQKRFKTVTSEELKDLQESRQAKSTKQNTKWGVKVFQEELNNVLGKFYAEATPKFSEKRGKEMSTAQSKEYHKNSMKNIWAAINRHIHDLDRDIDIVRDKEFRKE
ncbi:unnamed protein product [Mytilus coruscus]|uniref:Uncharacterized protein n=1 Tax=Mytilus coruscus TaxID=42192 RepID=A0A6J8BQ83_MYTCO|nr:unnamed protein product [Mytilus coruscus]